MRYLIVGVDVGTTASVAALDLDGGIVSLVSLRDFGLNGIIEHVRGLGAASLVASDVNPPPKSVVKIAAALGAKVFSPKESLSVEEKTSLTKEFECGNAHQRDALAAALNARKKFKNRLHKAGLLGLSERRKSDVLQGARIRERLKKKAAQERKDSAAPRRKPSNEPDKLKKILLHRKALLDELDEKSRELSVLREELKRVRSKSFLDASTDKEVSHLKSVVKSQEKKIGFFSGRCSGFRLLWEKIVGGEAVPVGLFPKNFNGVSFIPNRIPPSGEKHLKGTSFAFSDSKSNRRLLGEAGIPCADEKHVKRFEGCFYTNPETLKQLKKTDKESIESLIQEYRARRETKA